MSVLRTVFMKELRDAVRDRRTWLIALAISLLSGPVVFALLSNFIARMEEKVERREVVLLAPERAPTLVNFLERAGATVKPAPADWEAQLRAGRLENAVLVAPEDFEARLTSGATVTVEAHYDPTHDKAGAVVRATLRLVQGFNRELGMQRLLARGVAPQLLAPLEVEEIDLAPAQARSAQLLFIVPWMALMAAVFGALAVAIDVSAGERERGSLEPLMANPLAAAPLVLGKWAVVMCYAVVIVLLTMAGFLLSMQFIDNETLSALLQLDWRQALLFTALLLPFAGLMAAVNMLAATFGRSYKEAQTYVSYIAMTVQLSAIVPVFLTVRDASWQLWVPAVGQMTVLMQAVRGETITLPQVLVPALVAVAGTVLCLRAMARLLRKETVLLARS
jgi:sodium transport system permease protein